MNILISAFLLLTLSLSVQAERFRSSLHSVVESPDGVLPHILKLSNGRVAFIQGPETATLELMASKKLRNRVFELEVDEKYRLLSLMNLDSSAANPEGPSAQTKALASYEPTVLANLTLARSVFSLMRRDNQQDSQCYNRAHVWAYEEFTRSGLNSQKLFMFFTERYIWDYNFGWWFHVSPMVLVNEGDAVVQRVVDRLFTKAPRLIKTWTDIFIQSKRACPVVAKYSDYENHQQLEHCYLIPVSMYYWQPRDIDTFERTGYEKTQYVDWEVDHAYWEAF
ncbi:MAG TPA: protein-glutamine glutaminase family protein [Bacteriovoracaceae bacterium]|nr:protein-glutamine glutaminase family protein [Bacteriovoracaceae bacterium]